MTKTRKWLFRSLAAGIALLSIEFGSLALHRLTADAGDGTVGHLKALRHRVLVPATETEKPLGITPAWRGHEVLHPYLGYITDASRWQGADLTTETSRHGFPFNTGSQLFFEPSDERFVVAVLGGSVASIAASGGYPLEMELARVARFRDREIKVISLAQGGYKQPQGLISLVYLLSLGAHIDLVINLDGFNELALPAEDLIPKGVFPHYPRDWNQRVSALDPDLRLLVGELSLHQQRRGNLASFFDRPPMRWSPLANLLWKELDGRAESLIASARSAIANQNASNPTFSSHGPQAEYSSSEEVLDELSSNWQRSSQQLAYLTQSQGIEYHHFLQPNQYPVGSKPIAQEQNQGTWLEDYRYRTVIETGYPILRDLGKELQNHGIAFHDLTDLFVDHPELLYEDSCCHLNFRGNSLLKRALAEELAEGDYPHAENVDDSGLALQGYDPVAYFAGSAQLGDPHWEAPYQGIRYRFASEENQLLFLADSDRFIPQFGGWCAFGIDPDTESTGLPAGRYPVDPTHFEIFEDKLFLFFRSTTFDSKTRWIEDRKRLSTKGPT